MKKIILICFTALIFNNCTTAQSGNKEIKGLWYLCKSNGYNEILFLEDTVIFFLNEVPMRINKYKLNENELIVLMDLDTVFTRDVIVLSDTTLDLHFYFDGISDVDHLIRIKTYDETDFGTEIEKLYQDYVNRRNKSDCLAE